MMELSTPTVVYPLELSMQFRESFHNDWRRPRAIINLSVQVSHRHRNSWKAHILPQKVYKSANWNESSVEWTLVDLDFAFVIISNFEVVPQPRK